ncbi:MAG: YiiD C-terminal domain-containing protein [Gammaproteobacteria bacterium]|nr:YiiD C-terminal domain-containing protein [Gammaproteobacteria bacterium]MBU6509258.1 YiiD C-terminal domain-containing protein [Gammaproteobacteria bacterium]MDE1983199.1 YiiD C-terminal domain-containing protein [Gammaproteobacteria bacterium]MDE2107712.1 YiiD C-terminal domain-containing protein [Gammaproteobacteria bacterium]MDE2460495.1 YiiD C-terminal domain-containing protein [Gammaproteobacteria bacterium]
MSGMPLTLDAAAGQRLEVYLHAHIPLVQHMHARVDTCNAAGLTLSAPLAANLNHEGTAFGGSLDSLAMLACWGLVWLLLEPGPAAHIVVAESRMQFLRPVTDILIARCAMPEATARQTFLDTLQRRNKARLKLQAEITQSHAVCAKFAGQFVAYGNSARGR